MKVLIDAETKQILGASLLGIECDEVIHSTLDSGPARHAHSSDRHRIGADDARRIETAGVKGNSHADDTEELGL